MEKRMYEAPMVEVIDLEYSPLLAGSGEEPEQTGTSETPYSGEGL